MRDFGTHLLGLITTLITIAAVAWVEINWEFAIYSFTILAIIPVGACLVGLGSASGYYVGAKILHLPTSKTLTFGILFNAVSSFYLLYYIPYYFYEINGQLIREVIDFIPYLKIALTEYSLTFLRTKTTTGVVGSWGYAIAFIQFLGFVISSLTVVGKLKEEPYCQDCSKYYSQKLDIKKYYSDSEKIIEDYTLLTSLMHLKSFEKIGKLYKNMGYSTVHENHLSLDYKIYTCDCKNYYISLSMSKLSGEDFETIDKTLLYSITKDKII
tara:strand:+ start:83 stop:889 length:807 start_codon:yes stop_codon:yes gene_type:complete